MIKRSIRDARIIHVRRIFEARRVSPERGRRIYEDLKAKGLIEPEETSTGRDYVNFQEAEVLAEAL
jgi:hypothetical protein